MSTTTPQIVKPDGTVTGAVLSRVTCDAINNQQLRITATLVDPTTRKKYTRATLASVDDDIKSVINDLVQNVA